MASLEEPEELTCAVSGQMFRTPVITERGNTVELESILQFWSGAHFPVDPFSNQPVSRRLVLNWDKRKRVLQFLSDHPDVTPEGWPDRDLPSVACPGGYTVGDVVHATIDFTDQDGEGFRTGDIGTVFGTSVDLKVRVLFSDGYVVDVFTDQISPSVRSHVALLNLLRSCPGVFVGMRKLRV